MFAIEQIQAAHSEVKSGRDFPNYIRTIKAIGVKQYETSVADGSVRYLGADNFNVIQPSKYSAIEIAENQNAEEFKKELEAHQRGETDYQTFVSMCAETGIARWIVDTEALTCSYFGQSGSEVLQEAIPQ